MEHMSDPLTQQPIEAAMQDHRAGRLREAEALYRQALARDPDNAGVLFLLGLLAGRDGRHDEACQLLTRCVRLNPDDAAAQTNLGTTLHALGRDQEAMEHFRRAVALQPYAADAHYNMGMTQREQGQIEAAAESLRKAIDLKPELAPAWNSLGNALREMGRLEEAVNSYQSALRLRPAHAVTLHNLGLTYRGLMRLDEAMRCFDAALTSDPNHHECRVSRAVMLLQRGDFERGWREYEARWEVKRAFTRRDYPQPPWDGQDLGGRTILLYGEQGFGDAIQFARYPPLLASKGARVVLECRPELKTLFESLRGVAQVVATGDPLPHFDTHRPLMSLPMVCGTRVETIPCEVPYLKAQPHRVRQWEQKLSSDGMRVGLAWAGAAGNLNDRDRSTALQRIAPLARVPGVRFYSLQKGPAAAEAATPPAGMHLTDISADLREFADTAAAIQNLHLVICVDTAVGHLAGALGKPVWVLLSFSPDWRWMLDRSDTPWYPTMRLFRQAKPGDWDSVMVELAREFETFGVHVLRRGSGSWGN